MKNIKISITFLFVLVITGSFAQTALTQKTLLEKQVKIKIVKDFKQLNAKEINAKYDRGRRPSLAFSNDDGTVSLTLDLKPTQMSQEKLASYQKSYTYMFSVYLLDKTKKSNDLISINNHKVGFFKLKMPTKTGIMYTLMFHTNIGNQMLTCSFTCPIADQSKWEATADEIMNSLLTKNIHKR